jgi:hypothetical protein
MRYRNSSLGSHSLDELEQSEIAERLELADPEARDEAD